MGKSSTIMVQGTGTNVGKSLMVAALCRIFAQDGYLVAPFKSQNMALNSYVTRDGGEIARIQAFQAEAAGVEPIVDMNPILLKPKEEMVSQVVIRGKVFGDVSAEEYWLHGKLIPLAVEAIRTSLDNLRSKFDIIVMEGAGSPAEVYLKVDIANMRIAEMAGASVLLVADMHRGGEVAAIVGTYELLSPEERDRIKGVVINKFRGGAVMKPAFKIIEEKTGWPVVGVIPYLEHLVHPEEDSLGLQKAIEQAEAKIQITVIRLPFISNFTDFDPFQHEPGVSVKYTGPGKQERASLGQTDAIIIPGTKNTIDDLDYLQKSGCAEEIMKRAKHETPIVGICGGFQMLGREIFDPYGLESKSRERKIKGLGLLDMETTFDRKDKITHLIEGRVLGAKPVFHSVKNERVLGYEIHMGTTTLGPEASPLIKIVKRGKRRVNVLDGGVNLQGTVFGTYIHGIFENSSFRKAFLNYLRRRKGFPQVPLGETEDPVKEARMESLDRLARTVRESLNINRLYEHIGIKTEENPHLTFGELKVIHATNND